MVIRRHLPTDRAKSADRNTLDLHTTPDESSESQAGSPEGMSKVSGVMMNPTLVQHPPAFDICGSDLKYPTQDRTYSNLNNYSTNDYAYSAARRVSGLSNPSLGSTFSLEPNPHSLLTDGSFHTSPQALLSPPDSINGSSAAGLQHPLTTFTHSTLPKPYLSNASSDHFNGIPGGVFSSSGWSGLPMTSYDRHEFSTLPSTSAYSANGMSNHYLTRPSMDPRTTYQPSGHGLGQPYVSPNGTMRTPSSPYRAPSYYPSHDSHYSDASTMQQSDPENKGPGFSDTVVTADLINRNNQVLKLDIIASIQKGFFQVDNKWTCYRRNYFQVTCAFTYKSHQDGPVFLRQHLESQHKQVYGYAVSISAKTDTAGSNDGEARGLVQHTPKRKKSSETIPNRHPVIPQTPHHHHSNSHQHHTHGYQHPSVDPYYGHGYPGLGPRSLVFDHSNQIPPSYTFERIQFQKATANNGKRRAKQQFFHVVVELQVNIGSSHRDEWVVVATRESEPMVVRGRSPGHYRDNPQRRNSQGHMDQDRNDSMAHRGSMGFNPYGSAPVGSYDSTQSGHQSGYSGTSYHHCFEPHDTSPPSAGSSTTLNGSPDEAEFTISDNETLRSTNVYGQHQLTPPSDPEDETMFSLSRKRPLEDDAGDELSSYRFSPALCDVTASQSMDYPTFPRSKALCA